VSVLAMGTRLTGKHVLLVLLGFSGGCSPSGTAALDVNVLPNRNPLFVQVPDGGIRNVYKVTVLNQSRSAHKFEIAVTGLKKPTLSYAGIEAGEPPIEVKSNDVRSVKVSVTIPGEEAAKLPASTVIHFAVRDTVDGTETTRNTNFRGPGQ
jgi:polyferredoxin